MGGPGCSARDDVRTTLSVAGNSVSCHPARQIYLGLLRENAAEQQVRVLGWCLMTNHLHLILVPPAEESLSVVFRRVHGRYAQYFNARWCRSGHLWQNHFFSCVLAGDHLWAALACVGKNWDGLTRPQSRLEFRSRNQSCNKRVSLRACRRKNFSGSPVSATPQIDARLTGRVGVNAGFVHKMERRVGNCRLDIFFSDRLLNACIFWGRADASEPTQTGGKTLDGLGRYARAMRGRRCLLPGIPCHVTQRGVNRGVTFNAREDRETYLGLLRENAAEQQVRILAWCLMTNHLHLILVPPAEESLSVVLRRVHGRYAQYFNPRWGRSGHLRQNHFFSCVLAPDHLWAALAYVERNPVRAGMVARAGEYRWSTAAVPGRTTTSWSRGMIPLKCLSFDRKNARVQEPVGNRIFRALRLAQPVSSAPICWVERATPMMLDPQWRPKWAGTRSIFVSPTGS